MAGKPTYEELEKRIKAYENLEAGFKAAGELSCKEESLYHTLFEAASDAIVILQDYKIVKCNRTTLQMLGCIHEKDVLGFHLWDFSPPNQPDGSVSKNKAIKLLDISLQGTPQRFYWKYVKKNGEKFDAEISLNRLETDQGNAIQAIIRDFTELKKAEQALRESEEKYRILFDLESDALALIEIDTGNMLYVNKAFIELYGYSEEEILRMKNTDFSAEPEKTRQATQERGTYIPVRWHKKKDGTVFPTEITASIFKYQGRDVHIAAIRDITERKRLENQLQRSQKMESLGVLAGGVAHDLNNVLSGIVCYPEYLLMELPEDSKLRIPVEKMQACGLRAAAIVEDLLTITRGAATAKEPVNLNDIINEYIISPEFIRLKHFHPAVSFETNLSPRLFNMLGSKVHIRKAIMNLISNASEAIAGDGTVAISTFNRYIDRPLKGYDEVNIGEYTVLSVSDSGLGISSEELERIFEPFYSKKILGRSGTGLGLAVVWNVMQDHEGYINVKSDSGGSTFDLYFSATRDETVGSTSSIPIREYKGNGESILVVDDVASQRDIACTLLDKLGYKVHTVSSGEEAVEYLTEHTVDLLLLDMIMDPGINGRETYERITKIHPGQKAVIVSGFAETDEVKEAQRLGAGPYIKKPFTLEKIGLAIQSELKKP